MENNYIEVNGAHVVLDANACNELRIIVNELPEMKTPEFDDEAKTYVYIDKGVAYYGMYDDKGKWWSSRAGIINMKHDVNIVDITAVINGTSYACAITKEFAEYLLDKYSLPFHYKLSADSIHERVWILVQRDSESLIDRVVTDSKGYGVKVLDYKIRHGAETFNIEYISGDKKWVTFRDLPGGYRGGIRSGNLLK